jgi:hypothetical protein
MSARAISIRFAVAAPSLPGACATGSLSDLCGIDALLSADDLLPELAEGAAALQAASTNALIIHAVTAHRRICFILSLLIFWLFYPSL